MELISESEKTCKLNGLVCGTASTRLKMTLDFINSVGILIDLD
jgi:hypothetical protein